MAQDIYLVVAVKVVASGFSLRPAGYESISYFSWPGFCVNTADYKGNKLEIMVTNQKKRIIASVCWYGLNPLDSGGKVRTFNILKHMRYFKSWVIAPAVDGHNTNIGIVIVKGRFNKHFCFNLAILNYLWPDRRRWVVKRLSEINPDFVQAEGIWSFPAVRSFTSKFKKHSILVIHNIEHKVAEELSGRGWKSFFLKMVENYCYRRADILVVCSEEDRREIVRRFSTPEQKILVVPNGVKEEEPGPQERGNNHQEIRLLFMGKLNYGPNIAAVNFIEKLMPRLKSMKCLILGEGVERKIKDNIEYLGRVDEVKSYLQSADICLAPLSAGSGTRLKILEYLAMAKPVVATAKAVEGLGFKKGEDYLEAETLEEFEKAIFEILEYRELWINKARSAREFVLKKYSWDKIINNYEKELLNFGEKHA